MESLFNDTDYKEFISDLNDLAKNSNCLSRKVGAILYNFKKKCYVSKSFNYTPAPSPCTANNCCTKHVSGKCPVIHAEVNCIMQFLLSGSIVNNDPNDLVMIASYSPCFECSKMLLRTGIHKVLFIHKHHKTDWNYLKENGIKYLKMEEILEESNTNEEGCTTN